MQKKPFITHALMHVKMLLIERFLLNPLIRHADDPTFCQEMTLRNILQKNQHTAFGKHYDFSSIKSAKDFFERVPIHGYEELRLYIEKQIETGEHAIVADRPIMYAETSGTTGKPKYIPILDSSARSYKRAQRIFSAIQYRAIPGIFDGKILAIVSPAIEGHFANGVPYGSMSGLLYQNMPDIILAKHVLPPAIFAIKDYETKYRVIAAFALHESSITYIATANPSTLTRISEIINRHSDALIDSVETGNFNLLAPELSDEQKKQFSAEFLPNPSRAAVLKSLKERKGELHFLDVWPDLRGVATWTSGNCALVLPKLRKRLAPATAIVEMGYVSSEFRGTITIDCERNLGVPTIQDNFFEFVEVDQWDQGNKATLTLAQLEQEKRYYIIATTGHGLYRYFINDIIEVTGRWQNTPTIAFVQKGKGVTNLTGEKLYENQVVMAVTNVSEKHGIVPEFFMMLADQDDFSYTLYFESSEAFDEVSFTKEINVHLGTLNGEFLSKAQSGRIKFIKVKCLKAGAGQAYKAHCLQVGQREGQFKLIQLQYRSDAQFPFEDHIKP